MLSFIYYFVFTQSSTKKILIVILTAIFYVPTIKVFRVVCSNTMCFTLEIIMFRLITGFLKLLLNSFLLFTVSAF